MKYTILIITLLFILFLNNVNAQSHIETKYSTTIEAEEGSKLLNQPSRKTPKFISNYYTPEEEDIRQMELNFNKIKSLKSGNKQINNLEQYAYQYVGIIIDGNKYIYINAFSISCFETFPIWIETWKKEPITMYDGGDLYWGAVYNPVSNRFSQLFFNHKVKSF